MAGGDGKAERDSDSASDADEVPVQDQIIDGRSDELSAERNLVEVARIEEYSFSGSTEYERHDAPAEDLPLSSEWLATEEAISIGNVNEIQIESIAERNVPGKWLEMIRLALISFMVTSWFLSRTYDTPMYLILGIATAAITLDRSGNETRDRVRWIPVTLAVEVTTIIFIYLIVRLRH